MMINRAHPATSPQFPHCFATNQEQQQQQQQQQQKSMNDLTMLTLLEDHHHHQYNPPQPGRLLLGVGGTILDDFTVTRPIKLDPGMDTGLENYGISRTTSCPPVDKMSKGSFRKRKPDNNNINKTLHHSKCSEINQGGVNKAKKVKGCFETDELQPNKQDNGNTKTRNKETKTKEDSGDSPKPDFIHVRARRGQATDSHSLAERVRREKISERMKYLQDLVPGCNKITGKAGMLDEIINYVQSLQRQVEFLSMKLAAVSPSIDFNIDDFFPKEAFPVCSSNDPAMEISNLGYLQYNSGQQTGQVCGSNLPMSQVEMGIRRTISAPISIPEPFPDPSSLTQEMQSCLPWGQTDLQGIYSMEFEQASQQSFPSHTYTGLN